MHSTRTTTKRMPSRSRSAEPYPVMLRITPVAGPDPAPTLKLEGKLVGPWTDTLREACASAESLRLDLSAVNFVDANGLRLLRNFAEAVAGGGR